MDLSKAFAYSIAALTSICGIIVAGGWFIPSSVPSQLRVMLGVVLILLGIYRFAITNARIARTQRGHD